ncbi:Eco57I restriction-modification methylase domain-containing protein [Alkalinema pantanalense CENA528]|uniref:Eco57I restriction-modification methylase domain-containing protein n=1 Tax=Alkalinema pantanalense TaxID=1620705 RepID=UPI003D6E3000
MTVAGISLVGVQIEGNLLASDMPMELLAGGLKGQQSEDFGLSRSDKLADEIAIAWGDAKAYWAAFQRMVARLPEEDTATSVTREYWVVPLLRSLGFDPVYTRTAEVVDGQTFAISHRAEPGENKPPLHVVGCRVDLEKRPPSGNPRLSAHALVQEYLNRTEHLWAIATNGLRWRLLRDSSLMTRLTYVEFDLEQILNGENFAEFCLFYRLFHRSRLPQGMEDADDCLLEFYHQESIQQGGRVRDRLRDGVEQALVTLGNGFLQHQASGALREQLASGELCATDYYRQLLRLIYRLLFLMVAEARDLLLEGSDDEKRRVYQEYYSVERLRLRSEKLSWRREGFQDIWQGLLVTFRLFEGDTENWRGALLGLSPLNGDLFGKGSLPALSACGLDNHDLLTAVRSLSLYEQKGQLRRVNYAAIDVEEFGSVYESLLDFHPQVRQRNGIYEFLLVSGSERKTTGSYYTPRELVQQLIKSALEPVMMDRLQGLTTAKEKETALLNLKIIDPACGSGHFLLAAARRVGLELARVRTNELEPGDAPRREAQRAVIQNCIYGVDLNPLAVDLCKVGLWIEGFCKGRPLSFLDHRIKCGNSLVGVLDLECLKDGIPDEAYKPVTGDVKAIAADLKKRNKKERSNRDQLSIFEESIEADLPEIAEKWSAVGALPEETAADVRSKKLRNLELKRDRQWLTSVEACNLWTAAFFMPLTEENLAVLPTSEGLTRYLREQKSGTKVKNSLGEIVAAANELARKNRFFHWPLEFPQVFEQGGFDCVLGNPPWERIKLQEKEFFAAREPEIASAANKAEREKLIKKLAHENPLLLQLFEDAKHQAEAQSKFVRESGRFLLTAVGDVNTYAIFSETARNLLSTSGSASIIVPTGIATDDTCKRFFGDLGQSQTLASLYDFENREKLFAAVDSRMKFSLLTMTGKATDMSKFSFFSTNVRHLDNPQRVFRLSAQEIALLNPNTLTCPVFRTKADAELTKKIYKQVPVLENEKTGKNPWGISFARLFDMSNDSGLFHTDVDDSDEKFVPLYEAKMLHQFDHRWATYDDEGNTSDITDAEKADPEFLPLPRYWVERSEVNDRLSDRWKKDWLISFRDICRSTDERTAIFSLLPKVAIGNNAPIVIPAIDDARKVSCLLANFCSLTFDFVTRHKVGGTHMNFFIVKQLPVLTPETYTQSDIDFIAPRVLELVYTAWDMQPFAQDMGYTGAPFPWNPERRATLRAELDAYYAHLYGLTRDELRYILDPADLHGPDFPSETFRVLKNKEIKEYGEYRTQRLVLAAWDQMFEQSTRKSPRQQAA